MMKKLALILMIVVSVFAVGYALDYDMTDIFAIGNNGSGGPLLRVDSSGNLYCTDLTASDALNVTGTVTFSGESNFDEQVDVDLDARDEEFNITTSSVVVAGSGVLQVYNTSTSPAEQHYLLDLWQKNQGTDVDGDFIICRDSATSHTVFTVSENGNTAITGTLTQTGVATFAATPISSTGMYGYTDTAGNTIYSVFLATTMAASSSVDLTKASGKIGCFDIKISTTHVTGSFIADGTITLNTDFGGTSTTSSTDASINVSDGGTVPRVTNKAFSSAVAFIQYWFIN